MVKEGKIDVTNIRQEMAKAYEIKQEAITSIISDVLDNYKTVIHPTKLNQVYQNVDEVSKDILEHIPEKPLTLKEAEERFEKAFLKKALEENNKNVSKTAKKIGIRYETLHRKCKKLGLV